MITRILDSVVGLFSPLTQLRRVQARRILRSYSGAEPSRFSHHRKPRNLSADQELMGPFGADAMRSWARELVRNNSYAWGCLDTLVSSVVGCGIRAQSVYETPEGEDVEPVNDIRDATWERWCEVCEVNGQLTFAEIQALALREMAEAGEVLIRLHRMSSKESRGISRPVPLALELVEADRLAGEKDNYAARIVAKDGNRIIRGVELDAKNRVVAYWIYSDHPLQPYAITRTPERVSANEILHLFRKDRVGQTRGISWFSPVLAWLRDLGTYVENELQASAVASCFTVAIKSDSPIGSLVDPDGGDSADAAGNRYDYLQPGMIMHLNPNESIESANPGRPNSASEPWISLMLRGIAVGFGLSYEIVARDYSQTNYSSNRASQLEDRRRFRRIQAYLKTHLCQPVWDAFCDQAALADVDGFASSSELLEDRRKFSPVEWQTPEWEWVDPGVEQSSAQAAIDAFMSDYQTELGSRGRSWRAVFYQRAKEDRLRRQLGLLKEGEQQLSIEAAQVASEAANAPPAEGAITPAVSGTGEMANASRLQWQRNRKAIEDVLAGVADGTMSRIKAEALLSTLGLAAPTISALLDDAADGTVDTPIEEVAADGQG